MLLLECWWTQADAGDVTDVVVTVIIVKCADVIVCY